MAKSDIEKESEFPELRIPDYKPSIPEALFKNISPEMRELLEMTSVQTQYVRWLCEKVKDTNLQVRKTNGRLKRVEVWKDKLSNWVAVSIAITVSLSAIVSLLYKLLEFFQNG